VEHKKTHDVCNIAYSIASFEDELAPIGYMVYPFKMQVPLWLPESTHYKTATEDLQMRYYLNAVYAPLNFPKASKDIYVLNPARIKCTQN
jgi:hypothetical protein